MDTGNELQRKLLQLMEDTEYPIVQNNGQRKFGPPPDWSGCAPPKGCEVFIGKLPRDIYEDELVPLFSRVGKIYELRLMMDFSGSNRGYAFVTYTNKSDAAAAVKLLNGYEIRPKRNIGVVKSVDNCRLYVGGIPKEKTQEDVHMELEKHVQGIVQVVVRKNSFDRRLNRGFAFVEFTSHRAAAMARRALVPGYVKLWDQDMMVDWADPEPDIDDEEMLRVRVLYARNFLISTSSDTIKEVFEKAINHKLERVKKIYDYAFIHFYTREHAEQALCKLQNTEIDGATIEIKWAKPVDRELYRIQKLSKGNAKFTNGLDLAHTMLLYKQQLEKREFAFSPKEDEGIGSGCAGGSSCSSLDLRDATPNHYQLQSSHGLISNAPAKLHGMCKRFQWAYPKYKFLLYPYVNGNQWVCTVELPQVGAPVLPSPSRVGPFSSKPNPNKEAALAEAAENAMLSLKLLRTDLAHRTLQTQTAMPSMYQTVLPAVPNYMPYLNVYSQPPASASYMWRTV